MGHKETPGSANKPSLEEVTAIAQPYENSPLEADGMTNILQFFLAQANIPYQVMTGPVVNTRMQSKSPWHFWLVVETQEGSAIIDYRARAWLGNDESVPHGVFLPTSFPFTLYSGQEIEPLLLPEEVVRTLLEPIAIPAEWKQQYHIL